MKSSPIENSPSIAPPVELLSLVPPGARRVLWIQSCDSRSKAGHDAGEEKPLASPVRRLLDGTQHRFELFESSDLAGLIEPDTGDRFDCILGVGVLEQIPEPERWLKQLASRLAKGGHLVLGVSNRRYFDS